MVWLASVGVEDLPGGLEIRRRVLEDAVDLVDGLPELEALADERRRLDRAIAVSRAHLDFQAEEPRKALDRVAPLEASYRADVASSPGATGPQLELARYLSDAASYLQKIPDREAASAHRAEAIELLAALECEGKEAVSRNRLLLAVYSGQAISLFYLGDLEGSVELSQRTTQLFESMDESEQHSPKCAVPCSRAYAHLALMARSRQDFDEELEMADARIAVLEGALSTVSRHRWSLYEMAEAQTDRTLACLGTGDPESAALAVELSRESFRALANDFPDWQAPRAHAVAAIGLQSRVSLALGEVDAAFELQRECIQRWRALPSTEALRPAGLVGALSNLANITMVYRYESVEDLLLAEAALDECIETYRSNVRRFDGQPTAWLSAFNRSWLRSMLGNCSGAHEDIVHTALEIASTTGGESAGLHRFLATAWAGLGECQQSHPGPTDVDAATIKEGIYRSLETAADLGFSDADDIEAFHFFKPLHSEERFQAMLARVRKN